MILLNKEIKINNVTFPTSSGVYFLEENNIKNLINKANQLDIRKIYLVDQQEFLIKINKRWKAFSKYEVNLSYIKSKKFKLKSNIDFPTVDLTKKTDFDVEFVEFKNSFEYCEPDAIGIISFLLEESVLEKLNVFDKISFSQSYAEISNGYIEDFFNKLNNKIVMPGLPIKNVKFSKDFAVIKSEKGITYVAKDDNKLSIITIAETSSFEDSKQYSDSFNSNLINNALKITNNPNKLTKKTILLSVLSFVIVILLLYVTINHIFGIREINSSFEIMFDRVTWENPLIYLLIINFVVTFFYSFFLAMIMDLIFNKSKSPNVGRMWEMFLSAQVRTIAMFLTGNFIFSTIIWALYLNKKSGIRVSSLVGTVAVINILKSIMQILMVIIFMLPGSLYLMDIFSSPSQAALMLILGWGGMAFSTLHNLIVPLIILVPFTQNIYTNIKVNLILKKNNSIDAITKVNSEIHYTSSALNTIFKDKQRVIRIFAMTFIMTMFEAIETVMIFQMVENFRIEYGMLETLGTDKAHYWNFLSISGVRLMSTYVHYFPGLNFIPGQGIGITDLYMSNINELIVIKQHGMDVSDLGDIQLDEISLYSKQVTFITRFLNFYLQKLLSLIFVIVIVITSMLRYINRKHHNIKNV